MLPLGSTSVSAFLLPAFASSPFDAQLRDSNARSPAVSRFFSG